MALDETHRLKTVEMAQKLEIEILKQEKVHSEICYQSQISLMENTLRETKSDLFEKTKSLENLQENEKKIPAHLYDNVNFLVTIFSTMFSKYNDD